MSTPEYFHAVNDRSTLRQLITFMLDGEEAQKAEYPLNEGIEECSHALVKTLDACPRDVRDKVTAAVSDYMLACEHTYMQMGMQTGFRLVVELLYNKEQQPRPTTIWKDWVPSPAPTETD